jgi:RNA polymerase sigma-70 factor (ECF subfamily)
MGACVPAFGGEPITGSTRTTDVTSATGRESDAGLPLPRWAAPKSDERALVERARTDPLAFAELYERHVDRLYSYACRCLRDRMAAEDVVAETFQRALEHLPRYEWRGRPFSAWLFRIASNAIAGRSRRATAGSDHALPDVADCALGPEAMLLRTERRRAVIHAVLTLPLPQRQVVLLRYGEELRHKDIARIVGRSEGAVKAQLHRALHALARKLARRHGHN